VREIIDEILRAQSDYERERGELPKKLIIDRKSLYTIAMTPGGENPLDRGNGTLFGMEVWLSSKMLYHGTEQPRLIQVC
jgi:hypothetical protein